MPKLPPAPNPHEDSSLRLSAILAHVASSFPYHSTACQAYPWSRKNHWNCQISGLRIWNRNYDWPVEGQLCNLAHLRSRWAPRIVACCWMKVLVNLQWDSCSQHTIANFDLYIRISFGDILHPSDDLWHDASRWQPLVFSATSIQPLESRAERFKDNDTLYTLTPLKGPVRKKRQLWTKRSNEALDLGNSFSHRPD